MAERDFSEIARLSERYNKDPQSRIFVQLADAYRKSNMIDEALEILNKGLEYHPDYALGHLILGKCRFDKRLFAQAKESFEKTLDLDPQNIVALRMLAQTCENLKDENGQMAAYKGILAHDPFDATAKEKLARLEALHKKEPTYTLSMAQEHERQGDLTGALEIYEHLFATDPSDIALKQKLTQLKEKVSIDKKKVEEEKLAGLQVESYFQPEDIRAQPEPPPTPEVAAPETKPPTETTSSPEPPIVEHTQASTEPPEKTGTPAASDEVLPLEDFLSEEPAEGTPAETTPQVATPDKPQPQQVEEKETSSDLDILQPFVPEGPGEEAEKLDIVQPIEATEGIGKTGPEPTVIPERATAAPQPEVPFPEVEETEVPEEGKKVEPAPPSPPVEQPEESAIPIAETPAETEDLSDLLQQIETPEEKAPEPQPTEEIETIPQPETKPEPPPAEITPEIAPTPPQEPPTTKEKEEKPAKPKEEDFQSFQDWLSGLLK